MMKKNYKVYPPINQIMWFYAPL